MPCAMSRSSASISMTARQLWLCARVNLATNLLRSFCAPVPGLAHESEGLRAFSIPHVNNGSVESSFRRQIGLPLRTATKTVSD